MYIPLARPYFFCDQLMMCPYVGFASNTIEQGDLQIVNRLALPPLIECYGIWGRVRMPIECAYLLQSHFETHHQQQ